MPILIALITVAIITAIAFAVIRRSGLASRLPCALCIGVSGTWIAILAGIHAHAFGDPRWLVVASILIGGSAAGIAEQLALRTPTRRLRVKAIALGIGFPLAYAAPQELVAAAIAIVAIVGIAVFLARVRSEPATAPATASITRALEQCC